MANRLSDQLSPYLLQHRDNPVEWWPWSVGALDEAKARDVPILLSIGYAACHWCHVMERESFEDPATAAYMNQHFVPIKVDREERPDLDEIYIEFVQSLTGHGGWPLTVFLDPDGVPFHGGTYFPPEPRQGLPSFMSVMEAVAKAWEEKRADINDQAPEVIKRLSAISLVSAPESMPDSGLLEQAAIGMRDSTDPDHGGFGQAPKFPAASALDFMLSRGQLDAAVLTLDRMAAGGLQDQLAGGFCRYSVDTRWRVPHFEKMLYDNALLARTYLHAWQETGHQRFLGVATATLDWILNEMTNGSGGFHASLDADSEGEEGLFYTWTAEEFDRVLGEEAAFGRELFGVTESGDFEGRNVLHIPSGVPPDGPDERASAVRKALLEARSGRVRPATDDKTVCSWNALAISALAEAGAVLGRADYLAAASGCADFVWEEMRDHQGSLFRVWREGTPGVGGFLEDYAFMVEALIDLYEADFDVEWFDRARGLAEAMMDRFFDQERGGFFTTSHDHELLIARRKDVGDHPIPSGSASAALGLLRLAALTGEDLYRARAESVLRMLAPAVPRRPDAFGHLLKALDFALSDQLELAVVTPSDRQFVEASLEMLEVARSRYRPNMVTAAAGEGEDRPGLLEARTAVDGKTAAWVCRHFACRAPTTEPAELRSLLDEDRVAPPGT